MRKFFKLLTLMLTIVVMILASSCSCSQEQEPVQPVNPTPVEPTPTEPTVVSKEYKLHDWYASFETGLPKITLTEENYTTADFPIPTRENFTFNGWYIGEEKVADENGKSLMTEELFKSGTKDITVKWKAKETFTYKILLVYVTRIDAVLPTRDQTSTIHVDYTMSDSEREFCETTTIRLKETMDDMMDGLVDFQIDGYFTTEPIVAENFTRLYVETGINNSLFPNQIPEVKDKLKDYGSTLTVFSMDDFEYKLHDSSGAAGAKYGEVNLDSSIQGYSLEKDKDSVMKEFKKAVDLFKANDNKDQNQWITLNSWLECLIHETGHTIEQRINCRGYHETALRIANTHKIPYLETAKIFYLGVALLDKECVGIPNKFWKGEFGIVTYTVPVDANDRSGGYVFTFERIDLYEPEGSVNAAYNVIYGESITVTAYPGRGYTFLGWSDGVKTAERIDVITGDFTVTALFEPKQYNLTVVAETGGSIISYQDAPAASEYTLTMDKEFVYLKAIPAEGYRFVKWSDGETKYYRSFQVDTLSVDLFDENNNSYTLTAIFEKTGEESNYYTVNLINTTNGRYLINGALYDTKSFLLKKDEETVQVIAREEPGYKFKEWSDGCKEEIRTIIVDSELALLSDKDNIITLYAIFEKIY